MNIAGNNTPASWEWRPLGEVAEVIAGQSPPSSTYNVAGNGLPFFQGKTEFGRDEPTPAKWCNSPTKTARAGDILISVRAPVGPTNVAPFDCGIGRGLAAIRAADGLCPKWLRYWLSFSQEALVAKATGTTFEAITGAVLRAHQCPIPPLTTQNRIVARIDQLFSDLDDGEEELARARADLATYRKTLLKAAVTGELTADWRAANPPIESGADLLARILTCRKARWVSDPRNKGKCYKEPVTASIDALPELPSCWTWVTLDQLCSHLTSGSRAWSPYYNRGDCTFILAQNVRPGRYDFRTRQLVDPPATDPERVRTAVRRDDLLLTIVGANTGDLCRVDFDPADHFVCQSVALLRPELPLTAELIEAVFAGSYGRQLQMDKMIYGQGRPHLSFDQIRSLAVPLPPLAEIGPVLHAMRPVRAHEESLEESIEGASAHMATLRQSILAAAFRGELS